MERAGLFVRLHGFVGWVWFVGGVVAVGVAVVFAISTMAFIHKATGAGGQILNLIPVVDKENEASYYAPIFTFVTPDGRSFTITSSTSTYPSGFAAGQTMRVLYSPRDPADARLKSTAQLWMVSLIGAPLGLFLSTLGGMLLLLDRRYRRKLTFKPSVAIQ
jgi:hypothetical protein